MVDYEKVDKAVEELQKLHPDMPHYIYYTQEINFYFLYIFYINDQRN